MTRYARFATPLGTMVAVARDGRLAALDFEDARHAPAIGPAWREDPSASPLRECAAQLAEYFAATRRAFDLPLAPEGTPFQQGAWSALRTIPYGTTVSYGHQAEVMGDRRKARAVGMANGRNPIPIVVPCHRVVGSNGHLTGFAGGLEAKAWLLDHELRVRATR